MKTYVFPAVLQADEGGYDVAFPDIPNAFTCADDLASALAMGEDVLNMMLVQMEDDGQSIPPPSDMKAIQQSNQGAVVTLIRADTLEYRKQIGKRAVKKTLSIPQWMNEAAEKQGVNFSQVLQDALAERLTQQNVTRF